jgi:alginate O-acetyltransferase complex protein AlgI
MAIGLARMFGFHFPENFDRPYSALSLTDFWRRWHMSLSSWFRDYVYIPLGGNRRGAVRTYVNLGIVFLLTGLWHGANWTFIIWGCFHGAGLIVERLTGLGVTEARRWTVVRRLVTFALVCIGWAIFRAVSLHQGLTFMRAMVLPHGTAIPFHLRQFLTTQRLVWMGVGLATAMLPGATRFGKRISESDDRAARYLRFAAVGLIAPIACVYTLSSTFSPFLYFKF